MKKTLILTALLLSLSPLAHAGWNGNEYYTNNTADDTANNSNQTASATYDSGTGKYTLITSENVNLRAGDAAKATFSSITLENGADIKVDKYGPSSASTDFTIENLTVSGSGSTLTVTDGNKVTLSAMSGTGTLDSVTITSGTLDIKTDISSIHNLTFGADGSLGGTYNYGQDTTNQLTITLNASDAIDAALSNGRAYTKTLVNTSWNIERIAQDDAVVSLNGTGKDYAGLVFYDKSNQVYVSKAEKVNGNLFGYTQNDIITLDGNKSYLVLDLNQNGTIGALSVIVTPEPTTATLSLLALAGLAARRRRH